MALFGFGKKNNDTTPVNNTPVNTGNPTLNFNKEIPNTTAGLSLQKSVLSLDKTLITLEKKSGFSFDGHRAKVAVAMDYSGSMSGMFRSGAVQDVITRLLPIALKFDDNGELESWLFSEGYERLAPVTASNYEGYVKNVMMQAGMYMGGTNYAPALKDIVKYYKDKHPSTIPSFVMFITDGDNWDESETNKIVRELSNYNMFVQFVGIGNGSNFTYLRELDNLSGRKYDNTGFIAVSDMNKMDDQQLYTEVLRQYNDWLNNK
jgi:uncharacterized protein with von Willebrand factor type A (vWA) domain